MACRVGTLIYMLIARQQSLPMSASVQSGTYGTLLPLVTILEISRISRHLPYFKAILVGTIENPNFNY